MTNKILFENSIGNYYFFTPKVVFLLKQQKSPFAILIDVSHTIRLFDYYLYTELLRSCQ